MFPPPSRRLLSAPFLLGALSASLLPGSPARAQELPWLGKGQVSLDFSPRYWGWDSRYGHRVGPSGEVVEETELLASDLTRNPLGSVTLPYLRELESNLQKAMEDGSYRVRLGASQAILYQSHLAFSFRLEAGITDWLTVGAAVPLVRTRTEMDFALAANDQNADVGISPTVSSPSAVSRFIGDFEDALDPALEASPQDQTLLEARRFLDALSAAYWHGSVFPVDGSPAGAHLQARLDDLRTRLEGLGLVGVPQLLPLAGGYISEEDFAAFMAASRGMEALPLADYTRPWSVGDMEITASALLLQNTKEVDSTGNRPSFRYQVGVGAVLRLGTGNQAFPNQLLAVDPADGQMDVEGSVFARAELGDRFGAWGRLRYGIQREGETSRRITDPDGVLPNWGRTAPLYWTPGNYLDLEVNPWFYFTAEMAFGLRYHLWAKGEDRHVLQPLDPEVLALLNYPDPALLDLETKETLHEIGFSATYSTREAHGRGAARIPLVVRAFYFHPVMGSGGQTPKGNRLQVGLTLYRRLWGGGDSAP